MANKKYTESLKLIEKNKQYDSAEALDLVCKTAKAKFDETIELHVRLGVDSRHADQQVRGAVVLPHGTGKTVRTLVFCKENLYAAAAGFAFMMAPTIALKFSVSFSGPKEALPIGQ